jgi:predicted amidohydrolase
MLPTIAAIQMCSSSSVDENLKRAEQFILEASSNNAKLIVLPEMFAIMGDMSTTKLDVKEPFMHGKIQSFLSTQAKNNKVWIVGGTIPIECNDKNKIKAASLVFDDTGKCVARYDKIHLFDVVLSDKEIYRESDTTEPGNSLSIIDTPFGKIGLAVCYDLRFPELFRCFFNKGVEIIILPTAFTEKTGKAHWEVLARSRAIENFCYFIGSCQGGVHSNGRTTFGHSIIIGPWGDIISKKESLEPGIIYADIDINSVYEARKSIPIKHHQRIFFDTSRLE